MSSIFTKGFTVWLLVWAIGAFFVAPFVPTDWLFLAGAFTWGVANGAESIANKIEIH